MASARKIESNRANSKSSCGPRSAAGKARVAQNALRHGLAVPVEADRLLAKQVESLAQEIAVAMNKADLIESASRIAEAEVDLLRIHRKRHVFLGLSERDQLQLSITDRLVDGSQEIGRRGADPTKELILMDRYQRRALSRRRFAIRAFDNAAHKL